MSTMAYRRKKGFSKKTTQYHIYYKRTGLYGFLLKNTYKLIIGLSILALMIIGFQMLFPDLNQFILNQLYLLPDLPVLTIFVLSESFLGLIPPDLFIVWSQKFDYPYWMVFGLAVLSYAGGMLSYFIGKYVGHFKYLEKLITPIINKQEKLIRQFGGIIIVIAALFPLPFSPICMMAGAVNYPFKSLMRLGLFRFLRFFGYALFLFQLF